MSLPNYNTYAEIYDAQYEEYHTRCGDIEFYKSFCSEQDAVLDLGCGTGRIALQLASYNINVTGIDISEKMLQKAEEKRKALGNDFHERCKFICGDMRFVNLDMRFDLVYIGFRSFMLLTDEEEQLQVLENVRKHLKPSGRLIVSMFAPNLKRLNEYALAPDSFVFRKQFAHPNRKHKVVEYERKWIDEIQQIAYHTLKHITIDDNDIPVDNEQTNTLKIRWTYKTEFEHLARISGFNINAMYGDYFCHKYTGESKEMIWVLENIAK